VVFYRELPAHGLEIYRNAYSARNHQLISEEFTGGMVIPQKIKSPWMLIQINIGSKILGTVTIPCRISKFKYSFPALLTFKKFNFEKVINKKNKPDPGLYYEL
jgi:hypothetical protein